MILIVNNMETSIKNIIMSDDGSGNDIYIPIVMISEKDGLKLIHYLEQNKSSNVIVEINFLRKKIILISKMNVMKRKKNN